MIRLRRKDGTTLELPDMAFVEICDLEGNVAQVSYQDNEGGMHVVNGNDPEAEQYKRMFPDVVFSKIVAV